MITDINKADGMMSSDNTVCSKRDPPFFKNIDKIAVALQSVK
jgi:glutamine cyclotransferase